MRAGKSSRAESAAAIIGLILLSALVLQVFDTANIPNPTGPKVPAKGIIAPTSVPRPNGTLVVSVVSNQNTTNTLTPTGTFAPAMGVPVLVYLGAAPILPVYQWITDAQGLTGCIQCLRPGEYILGIQYDGLNMTIPADVAANNQTLVKVNITGSVYPVVYSKESGVLVTPTAAEYTMFAEVPASGPVANVSQSVFLTVSGGTSKGESSVNATVIALGAPTTGTQWLQLGTPSPVDVVDSTSLSMTAWTSSVTITFGPITYTATEIGQQTQTQTTASPLL